MLPVRKFVVSAPLLGAVVVWTNLPGLAAFMGCTAAQKCIQQGTTSNHLTLAHIPRAFSACQCICGWVSCCIHKMLLCVLEAWQMCHAMAMMLCAGGCGAHVTLLDSR